MSRLIMVSNRSPVTIRTDGAEVRVERSTGGLATALRSPHERSGGVWVGWSGAAGDLEPPQVRVVEERLRALRVVPVPLTADEVRDYYDGVAHEILWPLFHSLAGLVPLRLPDFSVYKRVNERFASAAVAQYGPGDTIWVHDYHLMLVPDLIRRALPDAAIGFFLHIPFPPVEVFRSLPLREELLAGVLGADLIGFHAPSYLRHFASAVTRILGAPSGLDGVLWQGRPVRLGVFPMGIDAAAFTEAARDPETIVQANALRAGRTQVLVGIDRLDHTKGIPRRLLAYETLLREHPELRGRVQLIEAAVPSRRSVEASQDLRAQVDELVGRVNRVFATPSWTPVQYLFRSLSERELIALYLAADAMLVTPLRDGMNLMAKEFVAARADGRAVLVLSEFTGAATELAEALHVNPYDVDGTAETYYRALTMTDEERAARMRALRRRVTTYDVHRWVRTFLAELARCASVPRSQPPPQSAPEILEAIARRASEAPRVAVLVDYDGTLVPFAPTPELAAADGDLLDLLRRLGAHSRFEVHVVSGRPPETLERWLGALPVSLHAEHGAWSRPAGKMEWTPLEAPALPWRDAVLAILDDYAARTPGAFVEEKSFGFAWHYRLTDPEYGVSQANDLKLHLATLLANDPVQVLHGENVIELRPHALHKGRVVEAIASRAEAGWLLVAMGDDRTDEDLFAALPPTAVAIHVGPTASSAAIRLSDVPAVRRFLRSLLMA
ncbi:MAG: bifunctional alpha,alpha-trehalose-phosphate synthase (UDP-forming)/trehalose-phosphatase [Candidatus Rokubacteria bacterium]|nr:bifunctional alpha,alpha-trehalose-phosphate synthase (UDP-forming)/trehalose-phosphatase [Candidatus Rokubacteria bacterium]